MIKKIEEISYDLACSTISYMKVDNNESVISMEHEYTKLQESDVEGALAATANYISESKLEMTGEDDEHWRYIFDNGVWYYEPAIITYDSDNRTPIK